jgi:hypothetical protein
MDKWVTICVRRSLYFFFFSIGLLLILLSDCRDTPKLPLANRIETPALLSLESLVCGWWASGLLHRIAFGRVSIFTYRVLSMFG